MAGKLKQTLYDILEVLPTAPQHEIYAAYKRAKATYNQDSTALYSMFTKEEARELMNLIEEAFTVLGNQASRSRYDRDLMAKHNPPEVMAPISGDDLPDFPAPVEGAEPTPTATASPEPKKVESTKVPEGFLKTRFGVYKIDTDLENTLMNAAEYSGPLLRKARQYKNITLDQMASETRISKSYLVAVESEDYHAMPARVFVRGFVVQMARLVGLDENKVANSYMKRLKKASLD